MLCFPFSLNRICVPQNPANKFFEFVAGDLDYITWNVSECALCKKATHGSLVIWDLQESPYVDCQSVCFFDEVLIGIVFQAMFGNNTDSIMDHQPTYNLGKALRSMHKRQES